MRFPDPLGSLSDVQNTNCQGENSNSFKLMRKGRLPIDCVEASVHQGKVEISEKDAEIKDGIMTHALLDSFYYLLC